MDLVNNITSYSFATSDVNTSTDTITETSHSYYTGLQGAFSSTGALPGGLLSSTLYYIINTGANTYKVATSYKNALKGEAVDITSVGSGTHTFLPVATIDGAKFNKSHVACVFLEYYCQRITTGAGATTAIEGGLLMFTYDPDADDWTRVVISEGNPDDAGIFIGILSDGTTYYTTSNFSGTPYISKLFWRARTFSGKNIAYSKPNR
jgi:hypothetical protein